MCKLNVSLVSIFYLERVNIMKKMILSTAILATMAFGGAANAASTLGNQATVSAPVVIAAANSTSATWTQDASFTGPQVTNNQVVGQLNITATGAHTGVQISGDGVYVSQGQVLLPFKNSNGQTIFNGTINDNATWNHLAATLINQNPGWQTVTTAENVVANIVKGGGTQTLPAGTYTATFYIQQYQD